MELVMPVSLSIKGVPDALMEQLRRRAASNHRSLQRELMAIVEAAVQPPSRLARAHDPSLLTPALRVEQVEAVYQVSVEASQDNLLDELDGIVAGTRFGEAPLLTREQLHDRALARELDFESRQAEGGSR